MFAGVGQRLAEYCQKMIGDLLGDRVVHGAVEDDLGTSSESRSHLFSELKHSVPETTGDGLLTEFEDGGADFGNGGIEIIDSLVDALNDLIPLRQTCCTLQRHTDGEDALDDPVVQIPGDAVPVVEDTEHTDPIMEACVLDCDACCQRQCLGQCLVLIAEVVGTEFIGEIEVAVDLVADSDGNAEERLHGRVASREPITVRVAPEVVEAQGYRLGDEEAKDPSSSWARSDGLFLGVAQSDGQELLEAGPCFIEHPQGAVAGVDQGTRLFDQVAEYDGKLDVCLDHEDGIQQPPELGRIINVAIRHGAIVATSIVRSPWPDTGTMAIVSIRVFLLDDHELVREGIRSLLESDEDIEVVGEAATAEEALIRIPLAKPDVAILDVRLEDGSGIDVCRDVRSLMPGLVCLMLTSFADDEALYASVMAGAAGYVLKQIKARDLIEDVKKVAGGASLMDPRAVARVVERISNPPTVNPELKALSPQEARILDLIAEGQTNRQVAEAMFLSEKTVKNYMTGLLAKLKMNSRTEAAIYATKLKAKGSEATQA
jgi:two-component system, NarL family, response regulator DevR